MKVLVTLPTEERHRQLIISACPEAEFVFSTSTEAKERRLYEDADVVLGNVPPELLSSLKKLKLVQLGMAGSDGYIGKVPNGMLLANASGAFGLAIAEHMLGVMLMLMKKLHLYRDDQLECRWTDEGNVTTPQGARVLVVGLGDIGGEFALRCKLLGAYCIGIRRTLHDKPDYVDELHTPGELELLLPTADVVALALPQSSESRGLMNRKRLFDMKRGAILLNVGRGSAIETDALVEALEAGHILAGLDVTDPEPLPADHPLWKCKNAMITPHISGFYHLKHTHDSIISIAAKNLSAYAKGEPIMNLFDNETGYRRRENRI